MSVHIAHEASFGILTSLRWTFPDWPENLEILNLHRERLLETAKVFQFNTVLQQLEGQDGLELLRIKIQDKLPERSAPSGIISIYKIRIVIHRTGEYKIYPEHLESAKIDHFVYTHLIPSHLNITSPASILCDVYLDTSSTEPSLFTRHKTTHRQPYQDARSRLGISAAGPTTAEVLIWNPQGEIMEASLCTPYFFRSGKWITPRAKSGGNFGVTRRAAISSGLCEEYAISKIGLTEGEIIWLSNAVRGFFQGRLSLDR